MKLPKSILLNLKISSAKAECERDLINFYPKWILPAKLILIFAVIVYSYLILIYPHQLSAEIYSLLMNIFLITGALFITITALKKMVFAFLGYLKTNPSKSKKNNLPVTVIIKLGFDKRLNMQSINSVLEQNYKNFQLVLLSNIKTKYSDFDKNILNCRNKDRVSKTKVSLVYNANTSELELLNIGIKTASTKLIAVLKSYSMIDKNSIINAVDHLKDENIIGVIGREIKNSKFSFGGLTKLLNGLKFNVRNDLLINSNGLLLFRKKERSAINFISLGINKVITAVVSQSVKNKQFIYDPNVKVKMVVEDKSTNRINKILETNLLKIDVLVQQWNHIFLKGGKFTEKINLNMKLFQVSIVPLMFVLYSMVFILTAFSSNSFEYLFFIAIVIITTNFFVAAFTIAIDFSLAKYILQSTLIQWFTDYLKTALKVFSNNKKIISRSLNYVAMRK